MWIFIETKLWVKYRKMSVWNEIFSRNEQSTCPITQFYAGALLCTFQEFVREIANQSIAMKVMKNSRCGKNFWTGSCHLSALFCSFILCAYWKESMCIKPEEQVGRITTIHTISWIFNAVFHTKRTKSYCEKFRRRSLLLSIDDDGKF